MHGRLRAPFSADTPVIR